MFKRLRKDRNKMLFGFFLETLFAVLLVIALLVYEILGYEITFIEQYKFYIIIAYLFIVCIANAMVVSKYLTTTEKYLNRTDITIASIITSAIISALTVTGKAIFKTVAVKKADNIVFIASKILSIFEK